MVWAQRQSRNQVCRCPEQDPKRHSVLLGSICPRPRSLTPIVMARPSLELTRVGLCLLVFCYSSSTLNTVIDFLEISLFCPKGQRRIISVRPCSTNLGRCVKPNPALRTLTKRRDPRLCLQK